MDGLKLGQIPRAGIVSVDSWICGADGGDYLNFWADNWMLVTDKGFPVEDFRSHEKWGLVAFVGGEVAVIIPGCKVRGYVACREFPKGPGRVYRVGGDQS